MFACFDEKTQALSINAEDPIQISVKIVVLSSYLSRMLLHLA